jgi:hypothetical protein
MALFALTKTRRFADLIAREQGFALTQQPMTCALQAYKASWTVRNAIYLRSNNRFYKMDILRVRHQLWSSLLADFFCECRLCGWVYWRKIDTEGSHCPKCDGALDSDRSFFPLHAASIINRIQEAYFLPELVTPEAVADPLAKEERRLPVVLHFVTLGEVLLAHFLRRGLISQGKPRDLINKLLDRNLGSRERLHTLFAVVANHDWEQATAEIMTGSSIDYKTVSSLYLEARKARNEVLHGRSWTVPEGLPARCAQGIWPLLNMFVALHNKFIFPQIKITKNSP